jgi:hypothetical protein
MLSTNRTNLYRDPFPGSMRGNRYDGRTLQCEWTLLLLRLDFAGPSFCGTSRDRSPDQYNRTVARGWESKSVEAQQAEASDRSAEPRPKLSPEAAARSRERESLRLSRQQVLQRLEDTQNPRHRKLLQNALGDLDEKLKLLDV